MDHSSWLPHGHCFGFDQGVLLARVLGDGITALSYFSIPAALLVLHQRHRFQVGPFMVLFAFFITACGLTHVMDILTVWHPAYRLDAAIRVITGALSISTAVGLWMVLSKLVKWPKRLG